MGTGAWRRDRCGAAVAALLLAAVATSCAPGDPSAPPAATRVSASATNRPGTPLPLYSTRDARRILPGDDDLPAGYSIVSRCPPTCSDFSAPYFSIQAVPDTERDPADFDQPRLTVAVVRFPQVAPARHQWIAWRDDDHAHTGRFDLPASHAGDSESPAERGTGTWRSGLDGMPADSYLLAKVFRFVGSDGPEKEVYTERRLTVRSRNVVITVQRVHPGRVAGGDAVPEAMERRARTLVAALDG